MYRICVLRRCLRHVICFMTAATVFGRGNLAATSNRAELEQQHVGWDRLSPDRSLSGTA